MTILCAARCRPKPAGPREAAPGFRLCWVCKDWLAKHLHELIELAPDLEEAMSRANSAAAERVSGSPTMVAELDMRAAGIRWQIHHDMVATIRLVMEERGLRAITRGPDIAGMARWLLNHVDWLAAHPSAAERAAEAATWPELARSAIHPNPAKHVKIGPCIKEGCIGILSAIVKPQDSLLPSEIVCSWWRDLDEADREARLEDGEQPHVWRADQWHALGRQMARMSA